MKGVLGMEEKASLWNVKIHKETFTSPTVATKFMRNLIADNIREAMACIEVPTKVYKEGERTKVFQSSSDSIH